MRRIRINSRTLGCSGPRLCALGAIAAAVFAAGVGLVRSNAQQSFPLPAIDPPGAHAASSKSAEQQAGAAQDANASDVAKQCADLLTMATELKKAVDKSSAGQLSVTVVRKANEIEQLAHRVRAANGKS